MPATVRLLIEHNPALAAQWHPSRNVELGLDLASIAVSSGKKAWWQCPDCAYEWLAQIASRNLGRGCPRCAGRVTSTENSLPVNHPVIATEYHPVKNSKPVDQISWKTSTKCWWQCALDSTHEWETSPRNRVLQGDGCPYCGGRFATAEWNLGVIYPEVAAEFDLEANYPLTPFDFTPKSNRKCHWKCAAGHRSYLAPAGRMRGEGKFIECARCSRHVSTPESCILVTHPEVAAEYDREKNVVPVEEVLYGSRIKRWWSCNAGHSWDAPPSSRTRKVRPAGCPECSPTPRTSTVEKALREAIRAGSLLTDIPETYNAFLPISSGKHKSMGVDIYGMYIDQKVVVEYDSWWWHTGGGRRPASESFERDIRKTQAMLAAGYLVVRVREERSDATLDFLPIEHENLLQLHFNHLQLHHDFSILLASIRSWLALPHDNVLG